MKFFFSKLIKSIRDFFAHTEIEKIEEFYPHKDEDHTS